MTRRVVLAIVAAVCLGVGSLAQVSRTEVSLTSVAYRVHRQDAMVAFYSEAFGIRFRDARVGELRYRIGELGNLQLKFVPIRDAAEFEKFPIHQLGFDVPDVARVIDIATRHGGRVQDPPVRDANRLHASIRDPDGNTIELDGPAK